MRLAASLIILVHSLTKSEKRYFKLSSNLQDGDKAYLALFDSIGEKTTEEELRACFQESQKGKNYEMAVKHLYKALLDCLVRLREKQDDQTRIFNMISKANILFEREMVEEALACLEKAKEIAIEFENDYALLLILRTELKFLSLSDFNGISEKELVGKQVRITEILKYSRNLNQHIQLYDILRHRSMYKGYIRSDSQKEQMNDLVLSELHLIANHVYRDGFEAKKLHMLFQAAYYLNIGSYKLAIRNYRDLISLFEANRHRLCVPPIYYYNAILGILDSLHVAGLYSEMAPFLAKLEELENDGYSMEFSLRVLCNRYVYTSIAYQHQGGFAEAVEFRKRYDEPLFRRMELLSLRAQLRLLLCDLSLAMYQERLKEARKIASIIMGKGKLFQSFPLFKVVRLICLLLQAELGNLDYLEPEIHSIKRNIHFDRRVYMTERLVFQFVKEYPLPVYKMHKERLWKKYHLAIVEIVEDKYERQLLKNFDFLVWIEHKLTRVSLDELFRERVASGAV